MSEMLSKLKGFISDILFPKFCLGCQQGGEYLCEDCEATLEISGYHQKNKTSYLKDLYYPLNYNNSLIKKLIHSFKYEPFVKELAKPLALLIIHYFQLLEKTSDFPIILPCQFPPKGKE